MNFPISIASYSFFGLKSAGKLDTFGYLNLLKHRYYVDNADIYNLYFPTTEEEYFKKVREAIDYNGLSVANLCLDEVHVWVDDPEEREDHKRRVFEYIKAADIIGAKTIRVDFGGLDGHTMPDEAFEYIVKTYKEYADRCNELGIKIGPENHWGWDRVPEYLKKVNDAVDSPAYGHLFHLGNFYDQPDEGTEWCIKHAMHSHIHAGSVPYAKDIIRRLAANGYEGCYSIEHHTLEHEIARVEWQLGAVRSMIEELKSEGIDKPATPDYVSTVYYEEQGLLGPATPIY